MERVSGQPDRFGKYLILDRIGVGGMSEVFLAKTEGIEGFERKVALKRIFPDLTAHEEFVRSFIHEARIGGFLYHHNVVQTLDFGKVNGGYYIALEYIEGTHLGQILNRCRERRTLLPPGIFMQLVLQIGEGLEYIHQAQVEGEDLRLVHRDIKPSNMLISAQGVVKISDFGVVKAESQVDGRTRVGAVKGTIGYMAPEQARGQTIGPAADLYAFGAMMFEMATLKRIYGQGDELTILKRVRDSEFMEPIEAAGKYIPELDRIIRKLLSNDPSQRHADASEVTDALRGLGQPVADRKALVAFIKELGLLDSNARETGPKKLQLADGPRISGPALPPVGGARGEVYSAPAQGGGAGGAGASPGASGAATASSGGAAGAAKATSGPSIAVTGAHAPALRSEKFKAEQAATRAAKKTSGVMPIGSAMANGSAGASIAETAPAGRSARPLVAGMQDWMIGFMVVILGVMVALGAYLAVDAMLTPPQPIDGPVLPSGSQP